LAAAGEPKHARRTCPEAAEAPTGSAAAGGELKVAGSAAPKAWGAAALRSRASCPKAVVAVEPMSRPVCPEAAEEEAQKFRGLVGEEAVAVRPRPRSWQPKAQGAADPTCRPSS
jgi:hypothetical protein